MGTSVVEETSQWWLLPADDAVRLLAAAQELSQLRDLEGVMAIVRRHARELMRADGVTFVLRDGEQVYYADEDAIAPLWKGRRFPRESCISGWVMDHKQSLAIADVFADSRVPFEAYRPTFVKSLLMVPIRREDPVGAIGAYWATKHQADDRERLVLETLAGFAAVAVANAELYQRAQAALHSRDDWIGIASHELRTPLTPMKLELGAIKRAITRGVTPTELAPRIDRAERNVNRLVRLIEQLLDYSRFANGGLDLEPEPFDFVTLAKEVCDRLQPRGAPGAAGITFSAPPSLVGTWDPLRAEEVLVNLVSNAVKYGQDGPIRVEVSPAGTGVRVVVTDAGIGIAPDDQERVFQPFARMARSHQGVGLGLWIVRKIVQAHQGSMDLQSALGRGTSVTVVLPSLPAVAPPTGPG